MEPVIGTLDLQVSISTDPPATVYTCTHMQPSWSRSKMIFGRTLRYSVYTPYSIYFRMVSFIHTWTSKVPIIIADLPFTLGIEAIILGTLEVQVYIYIYIYTNIYRGLVSLYLPKGPHSSAASKKIVQAPSLGSFPGSHATSPF